MFLPMCPINLPIWPAQKLKVPENASELLLKLSQAVCLITQCWWRFRCWQLLPLTCTSTRQVLIGAVAPATVLQCASPVSASELDQLLLAPCHHFIHRFWTHELVHRTSCQCTGLMTPCGKYGRVLRGPSKNICIPENEPRNSGAWCTWGSKSWHIWNTLPKWKTCCFEVAPY